MDRINRIDEYMEIRELKSMSLYLYNILVLA